MHREIEIGLQDIFYIIRRRFLWLVLATAVCAGVVWAYSSFIVVPRYTATATMYVYSDSNRANSDESAITSLELSASKTLVNTYLVILKSDTVVDQVINELDLTLSASQLRGMMSASSVNQTEAFSISITNESPQLAKEIVNAFVEIAPREIVRVVKAGGVEVIDFAKLPISPTTPKVLRNTAIGGFIGLALCFLGFLLGEVFNVVIRSEDDLEKIFDIPVLGNIPKLIEVDRSKAEREGTV